MSMASADAMQGRMEIDAQKRTHTPPRMDPPVSSRANLQPDEHEEDFVSSRRVTFTTNDDPVEAWDDPPVEGKGGSKDMSPPPPIGSSLPIEGDVEDEAVVSPGNNKMAVLLPTLIAIVAVLLVYYMRRPCPGAADPKRVLAAQTSVQRLMKL